MQAPASGRNIPATCSSNQFSSRAFCRHCHSRPPLTVRGLSLRRLPRASDLSSSGRLSLFRHSCSRGTSHSWQHRNRPSKWQPAAVLHAVGASAVLELDELSEVVEFSDPELLQASAGEPIQELLTYGQATDAAQRLRELTEQLNLVSVELDEVTQSYKLPVKRKPGEDTTAAEENFYLPASDQQMVDQMRERERQRKERRNARQRELRRLKREQTAAASESQATAVLSGSSAAPAPRQSLSSSNTAATSSRIRSGTAAAASTSATEPQLAASAHGLRTAPVTSAGAPSFSGGVSPGLVVGNRGAAGTSAARSRASARLSRRQVWGRSCGPTAPSAREIELRDKYAELHALFETIKREGLAVLLSADQEKLLGVRIQDVNRIEGARGKLAKQVGCSVSDHELAMHLGAPLDELQQRIALGKASREAMQQCNKRLVMALARRYVGQGLDYQDLLQEGMHGLARAVAKFDPKRGFKFSTYAHWWIRQSVSRAITDQGRSIRVPVHVWDQLQRAARFERNLTDELGRMPTTAEVAERMRVPERKLLGWMEAKRRTLSTEQKVMMDNGKGDDANSATLADAHSEDSGHPLDGMVSSMLSQDLQRLLNGLGEREAQVLQLRFGMVHGREHTLEEVGNMFGVTRERIRQVETKALRKLRRAAANAGLHQYVAENRPEVIEGLAAL